MNCHKVKPVDDTINGGNFIYIYSPKDYKPNDSVTFEPPVEYTISNERSEKNYTSYVRITGTIVTI